MPDVQVVNNAAAQRFEALVDGQVAGIIDYRLSAGLITLLHTEVDPAREGQGIGGSLVRAALDSIRGEGERRVHVQCPFVDRWIEKHPDYAVVVAGHTRPMDVIDNGPQPNTFDIETATVENTAYRTVAWTGRYLQVTLMSIPVGTSIGLEVHPETDQFLRVDQGAGRCVMGPAEDALTFSQDVSDGWSIQVPAGTWHDVVNTGEEPLQLYAVYAPVHHAQGTIHPTAAEAEADEESGQDEPPAWTVQP